MKGCVEKGYMVIYEKKMLPTYKQIWYFLFLNDIEKHIENREKKI